MKKVRDKFISVLADIGFKYCKECLVKMNYKWDTGYHGKRIYECPSCEERFKL